MKIIRINLTPIEPYFFGNDKNLKYISDDKKKTKAISYYAVSEKTPSQSTLFGVLRYLGLSKKNIDYSISDEDIQNIGNQSFRLLVENKNGFGKIEYISNLYLTRDSSGEERCQDYYVRMPFDHDVSDQKLKYQPFPNEYYNEVYTSQGVRMLPVQYKVKCGFADGYVNLKDGIYVRDEEIFKKVETIGIKPKEDADGYFKRVRYLLEKNFSFTFFAYVKDDFYLSDEKLVYMGYGKSTFAVKTEVLKSEESMPSSELLTKDIIFSNCTKRVALSDIYMKDPLIKLYQCCAYVNTQSSEYREFSTNYGKHSHQQSRFQRGTHYIHLIKAGSIFYVHNNKIGIFDEMIKDENAQIAGFNKMTEANKG